MATMRAMAVIVMRVFNIAVIALLISQRASRQITTPKHTIRTISKSSIMGYRVLAEYDG